MAARFVKLADSSGGFHDPETRFGLVRDEIVQLPDRIGKLTAKRLATGGLIECVPKMMDDNYETAQVSNEAPESEESLRDSTSEEFTEDPGPPTDTKKVTETVQTSEWKSSAKTAKAKTHALKLKSGKK